MCVCGGGGGGRIGKAKERGRWTREREVGARGEGRRGSRGQRVGGAHGRDRRERLLDISP